MKLKLLISDFVLDFAILSAMHLWWLKPTGKSELIFFFFLKLDHNLQSHLYYKSKYFRVWRIFTATGPVTPRFTSSFSSTMIVLALVIIEAIINTVWLLWDQPVTKIITVPPDKRILVCNSISEELITSLIYPFFLILIATVYAFLTRKVPGGFNETKFIFFANTLTCIHWFAYVPLYLASTDHFIKPFVLSISLSVSGYVQMGCLIFPKLYTGISN